MNVKKIISLIMLLFMLLPLGAQNSEGKQRYKIAACDKASEDRFFSIDEGTRR